MKMPSPRMRTRTCRPAALSSVGRRGGGVASIHQRLTVSCPSPLIASVLPTRHRYRRVWQVDVHQTDANYPRQRILGRGQARLHQAGVPEHLHGDAVDDPGDGPPQDPVHRLEQHGECERAETPGQLLMVALVAGQRGPDKGSRLRDGDHVRAAVRASHKGPVGRPGHPGVLRPEA